MGDMSQADPAYRQQGNPLTAAQPPGSPLPGASVEGSLETGPTATLETPATATVITPAPSPTMEIAPVESTVPGETALQVTNPDLTPWVSEPGTLPDTLVETEEAAAPLTEVIITPEGVLQPIPAEQEDVQQTPTTELEGELNLTPTPRPAPQAEAVMLAVEPAVMPIPPLAPTDPAVPAGLTPLAPAAELVPGLPELVPELVPELPVIPKVIVPERPRIRVPDPLDPPVEEPEPVKTPTPTPPVTTYGTGPSARRRLRDRKAVPDLELGTKNEEPIVTGEGNPSKARYLVLAEVEKDLHSGEEVSTLLDRSRLHIKRALGVRAEEAVHDGRNVQVEVTPTGLVKAKDILYRSTKKPKAKANRGRGGHDFKMMRGRR